MNMNLSVRDDETGEVYVDVAINELDATYTEMVAAGTWHHTILDNYAQEVPHYFSSTPLYCMKHVAGAFFGQWRKTPGDVLRAFKVSREYKDAMLGVEGSYAGMLDLKQWKRVDQKNRLVSIGYDKNWGITVPKEAGYFALIYLGGGMNAAILNSRKKVWMSSLHAIFSFVKQNTFSRNLVIVVESTGGGKWQFRPECDPHSGL